MDTIERCPCEENLDICTACYECPACGRAGLCAAEFLVPKGGTKAVLSDDLRWGDVFMDQAISHCPFCDASLWAAYGSGQFT